MSLTHFARTVHYAPLVLLLAFFAVPMKADLSTRRSPAGTEVEKVKDPLKQQALDRSMSEALRHARYDIKWAERTSLAGGQGAYGASNPAQHFYSHFTPDGLNLADSSQPEKAWQLQLKLQSLGYGARQQPVSVGSLSTNGNRIEYARQALDPQPPTSNSQPLITEWYVNREERLEQGFTLAARPGLRADGEPLRLSMTLQGDLRAEANGSGQSVRLLRANGEHVLDYEHLVVKDADGKTLEASMGASAERMWLEVDDSNAVYPVTIDPAFVQQTFIKASNTDPGDAFGTAVAISGDTLVVGAPAEASNATGINGDQSDNSHSNAGAVYVFVRTNGVWAQQAYLKPPDTSHAQFFFGQAVAISGDTIVVGRPGIFAGSAGVAYVFVRSGVTWSQQASLIPSDVGPSDNFGYSVAIEGDTVVIGAPFPEGVAPNPDPRPGFAFVFVRNGVTWSEQAKLMASNANTYDGFGWSVAVSGNSIVVGANNEDSNSTGINNDGGNNLALNAGAAYAFVRSGVTWSQQAYIKASNTDAIDHFGSAVGIAGDSIVVGAPIESSNATGINGNQNDNSANASGAVYVFARSGVTWSQQAYVKASNTDAGDGFGSSIAIQGDAMIVGAAAESSNATGVDGNQSNNSASNAGAAYSFVRSGVTWSQQSYLKASNTALNAQFGYSVALSGGTLLVGARQESSDAVGINGDGNDNLASSSGAAYVFVPFSFTNNQPSIFSVDVTPQQGSPFVHSQIARVGDIEDAPNTLTVTINGGSSATVNGVTVTLNPTSPNATGQIFADVVAACTAAPANFTLRVMDSGGLINESILTVLIKPNDLPLLGTYVVTSVAAGATFNVNPSAVPSDNGNVSNVAVSVAPASFTGTATVNQSTGVVSITNANPPGVYTVTVTATDNCGATFSKDFRLTVNSATGCTIVVNSTTQEVTHANPNGITNGNCTLGEAILTANTGVQVDGCSCSGSGSPYRIVLSNTTYTLSARHNADYGFNGLPSITSEITIQGNGAIIERNTAAGTPTFRLFNVSRVGDLTLQSVTLRGGLAKGGNGGDSNVDGGGGGAGLGGAIYNHGRLTVTSSTLTNNIAQGGNGGNGPNVGVFGNGGGGGGLGGNGGGAAQLRFGSGGGGGSGGNGGRAFDVTGCQLGCPTGGGGGGGDQIGGDGGDAIPLNMGGAGGLNFGGRGGDGAQGTQINGQSGTGIGGGGGGAYLGNAGDGNIGGGGGGGLFGFAPSGLAGNGGFGGGGGGGNGLYVLGGNGGFGGGSGGFSIAGFEGFGGGNGGFLSAGGGGGGGLGGAIFSDAGVLVITNATLSGNLAKGGAAGAGAQVAAFPPAPGQGLGAGIFARNAFVTINYVTLNNNSVTDGTGATVALGGGSVYLLGDGKMATRGDPTNTSFSITNTILANTPGNASDAFVNMINSGTASAGTNSANLVEINGSTSGADANDLPGVTQTGDPNLGPLTLNAPGMTATHALQPGSPAIDQAIPAGGVTADQRGLSRPIDDPNVANAGDGSDIGAYEAVPSGTCILTCSQNIARSNDPNQCGAAVTYQPPGVVGSCGTVTCSPASGSSFAIGITTVTCSVAGGPSCSFTVTIQDTQPPTVTCPAHIDAAAPTGQSCTPVNYATPTANDNCTAMVNCLPASGTCFALGTTTVSCTATDASQNTGNCSFTVTVSEQTCALNCPANVTKSNDPNQCGATVTYSTPTVPPGCGTVNCTPASGTFFARGTTTVTCSIMKGPSCSFTVTVNDTQPPAIACPANMNATTSTGQGCATVTYTTPTASDNCGGSPMVNCAPASGTCFPLGTTTVTCTAVDTSKNTGSCSFTVTVAPPCTITCPANITKSNDPNQCGAVVTFAPTTTGGGCGTTGCSPASGSFFPKGTTTVTCSTTAGPSCSFLVTVNDTQPPVITCPASINIAAEATCPPAINKVVTFAAAASDNCPGVNVVCSPPSGSTFPRGTTNVTCTAIDSSGNTIQCSFAVSVFSACLVDQSNPGNVVLFDTQTGDYRFCCSGTLLAMGKGVLTMRGCVGTIDDQKGARKVHIGFDFSANNGHGAGTAALFLNGSTNPKCSITDQSMAGNVCACASAPPVAERK